MIIIILWCLLRVINSPSWLCSFYFNFVCRLVSSSGNHAVFGFSDRVLDSSWKSSNSSTCCCLITLQDKDHVTNEEVRTKIQQAIGPHEDLLTVNVKEMQTAVVWPCLPLIRSGQNHLARHSERGKKTRQTEEEVGRQHQGKNTACSSTSPRGQWRTGKNGENWLQNHLWCPNDPRG